MDELEEQKRGIVARACKIWQFSSVIPRCREVHCTLGVLAPPLRMTVRSFAEIIDGAR